MSGTSLDAVDSVVTSIDAKRTHLISSYQHPIPAALRQQILAICNGQSTTIQTVGLIDHKLGKLFATTVNELLGHAQLLPQQIKAIGSHGQTLFHQPSGPTPFTMQLGDANLIATLTGIDTIADFRRIDMALGGQGAPLVPAFHQYLFKQRDSTTVVLNIGGIANISVIPVDGEVSGYDTGPGNLLMDAWCEKHTGQQYDQDGHWARQGDINEPLFKSLMADPFISKTAPKSTGREHYNLNWLEKQISKLKLQIPLSAPDVQRTLLEFTVCSVTTQVHAHKQGESCELLVCGGGASNPLLTELLQLHLPDWQVMTSSERGVPSDYMEAMAFAWLARQKIHNQPSNLPEVTGATHQASLGVTYSATDIFHE